MQRKDNRFNQPFLIRIFSAALLLVFLFFGGCNGKDILNSFLSKNTATPTSVFEGTLALPSEEQGNENIATSTTQLADGGTEQFVLEKNKLVVWLPEEFSVTNASKAADIFKQHVKDFERQYPGTEVVLRVKAATGEGNILDSLYYTKIAASQALPQLALLSQDDMENAAEQALLLPVEDFISENEPLTYFPYAQEISRWKGVRYGFPFVGDALVGLADGSFSDLEFTTWKEVQAKHTPLYFAANSPQAMLTLSQYLSTGASLVDEQGNVSIDYDQLRNVFIIFTQNGNQRIFQKNFSSFSSEEEIWPLLQNGDIHWEINWYSKIGQSGGMDLRAFPIPSLGADAYVSAKGWLWTIVNRDGEVAEIVPAFIAFFNNPQFLAEFSQASGYLPVSPESLALYESSANYGQLSRILNAAHRLPANNLVAQVGPILRDATVMVLSQNFSIEEIIEKTRSQVEALQEE